MNANGFSSRRNHNRHSSGSHAFREYYMRIAILSNRDSEARYPRKSETERADLSQKPHDAAPFATLFIPFFHSFCTLMSYNPEQNLRSYQLEEKIQ